MDRSALARGWAWLAMNPGLADDSDRARASFNDPIFQQIVNTSIYYSPGKMIQKNTSPAPSLKDMILSKVLQKTDLCMSFNYIPPITPRLAIPSGRSLPAAKCCHSYARSKCLVFHRRYLHSKTTELTRSVAVTVSG